MRRIRIASTVAALVAILLAACAPRLARPDVHLVGVRLGGLGLRGGLVYVQLGVINPNDFPLEAAGLTYDVELRDPGADGDGTWVDLAEGRFSEDVRVPARDSTVVEIPVEFTYVGASAALRSVLELGTFSYRVRGEVALSDPVRMEVPYRHSGTVSVLR